MADVRSMLRQQKAARQQAQRPPRQSAAPATVSTSKKRKAAEDSTDDRKRTRTEEDARVPAGFFDAQAIPRDDEPLQQSAPVPEPSPPDITKPTPTAPPLDAAAEAELDALMNEVEQERPPPQTSYTSGAVIESKPLTTAEIAAQAREEQSAQRAKRDEEMEGEKEDAARALEDEFDEMEGLEERVKKLREQREALRFKPSQAALVDSNGPEASLAMDEESDSDGEDWDDWRFHPA